MGFQTGIPIALTKFGLKVETVAGWETRGSSSFSPGGVVCHWTAGPRNSTTRPSLNVVVNGRSGLPGPLCNVYLDRNGIAIVVAAGRANHAGAGGYRGLVGNSSVFGIEAECGGDGDWTDAQREAYPKVVAALLSLVGRDASWACGHNEWAPSRKIDIRDWDMPRMRQQVAGVLAGGAVTVTNPVTPTPASTTPVLRHGARGDAVKKVQAFLGIPADGIFGNQTLNAVVAYQRGLGLTPDGIVGAKTWAKINAGARPSAAKPASKRSISVSKATQAAVRAKQDGYWGDDTEHRVNVLRSAINGQFPAGVKVAQSVVGASQDGVWGPKSKAALKATVAALQRAWGTTADGLWGPKTESAWSTARANNYKTW